MRKIFAMILAVGMLLSMAACGGPGVPTPTQPSEPTEPSVTEPSATEPLVTLPSVSDDKTKPIIDSVSIDKHEVSVGDEVHITMAITDESEIRYGQICFKMSNGSSGNAWCYISKGDDGLYHSTIKIDDSFALGRCTLWYITVYDAVFNETNITDASGKYPEIYFDVLGGSNDKTKPIIDSVSIDKHEVSVGDEVHITMAITDESEIRYGQICFKMSNGNSGNAWCYISKGDDGLYHGTIKIDDSFALGRCTLWYITVYDAIYSETNITNASEKYPEIYFDVITGE